MEHRHEPGVIAVTVPELLETHGVNLESSVTEERCPKRVARSLLVL
jgi:hypothetical protein